VVRAQVDGRPVEVCDSATVLDAARAAAIEVPTLCHDDRLTPSGNCRVCLVRANGMVVAACVTPVTAGMSIETNVPAVAEQVRLVVELTAERLPEAALGKPTEFAALCQGVGVDSSVFSADGRGLGRDDSHPYFALDRDLCIACGRCVRMCDEVRGTFALTLVGRGADTVVAPGRGGPGSSRHASAVAAAWIPAPPAHSPNVPARLRTRPVRPAATAASAVRWMSTPQRTTSHRPHRLMTVVSIADMPV